MLSFLAALFFMDSCKQMDLFEKNTTIPNQKWQNDFNATGSILITDTSMIYNIYIVLRHTDAYQYNNIWLNVGLQSPGEDMNFRKINIPLGNDANGWDGVGMNDIWEVRKLMTRTQLKKGEYKFNIGQIMRDTPLPHILSIGLRVEKTPN
jgi:gliding motility-associated lipoprotein GldH